MLSKLISFIVRRRNLWWYVLCEMLMVMEIYHRREELLALSLDPGSRCTHGPSEDCTRESHLLLQDLVALVIKYEKS